MSDAGECKTYEDLWLTLWGWAYRHRKNDGIGPGDVVVEMGRLQGQYNKVHGIVDNDIETQRQVPVGDQRTQVHYTWDNDIMVYVLSKDIQPMPNMPVELKFGDYGGFTIPGYVRAYTPQPEGVGRVEIRLAGILPYPTGNTMPPAESKLGEVKAPRPKAGKILKKIKKLLRQLEVVPVVDFMPIGGSYYERCQCGAEGTDILNDDGFCDACHERRVAQIAKERGDGQTE